MPEVPTPARTLKVATLPDTGGPLEHLDRASGLAHSKMCGKKGVKNHGTLW